MKFMFPAIAAMALAGTGAVAFAAAPHGYTGQELASRARITMVQARDIALRAHPGTITDVELENEAGGSGLRYSFDIKRRGKAFEVGVDAMTGAVLENLAEGPNPD